MKTIHAYCPCISRAVKHQVIDHDTVACRICGSLKRLGWTQVSEESFKHTKERMLA